MSGSASDREATTEAVVLRLQDYREADRLVWLLTGERGRVSCVARGARKSRKRFGGHLDLFQRVRVRLRRGRGTLHALVECRVVDAWPALRADVERYAAASFLAELAAALAAEEAEDPALYEAVTGALARLAEPSGPLVAAGVAALALRVLATTGFVMDLGACSACGRALADPAAGGALLEPGGRLGCAACAPPDLAAEIAYGVHLTPAEAGILARWQRARPGDPIEAEGGGAEGGGTEGGAAEGGAGAVAAVRALVHEVAGRVLKSEPFLWQMLAEGKPEAGSR